MTLRVGTRLGAVLRVSLCVLFSACASIMTHSLFALQAAPGWDPVTGLGTPDFGKLKTILSQNNLPLPATLGGLLTPLQVLLKIMVTIKLL